MNDFHRPWAIGLRSLMLKKLCEQGPLTSRDMANACQVSEKAVAPRWTELALLGLVRDTGRRKHSISGRGRTQKVWEATT
jgi:predicted ArsR family transcriptional regulator